MKPVITLTDTHGAIFMFEVENNLLMQVFELCMRLGKQIEKLVIKEPEARKPVYPTTPIHNRPHAEIVPLKPSQAVKKQETVKTEVKINEPGSFLDSLNAILKEI